MAQAKVRFVANKHFIGFHVQGEKSESEERKKRRLKRLVVGKDSTPLPEVPSRKHPLHAPILKLHVAQDKIAELRSRIGGCITSKLNTVQLEDDPKGPHKLVRLVVGSPPDPKWDVEIGQIAVLLRSVLDISITQLSKHIANRPVRPQFPIYLWRTRKTGKSTYVKGGAKMVAHLPPAEQALIEGAQPYRFGNLRRRHPLWLLHELSNLDKHNDLTEASLRVGSTAFTLLPMRTPSAIVAVGGPMQLRAGVPFKDGAIMGSISRTTRVKPQFCVAIRFARGCPGAGEEVISTLNSIDERVRKIVAAFLQLHP